MEQLAPSFSSTTSATVPPAPSTAPLVRGKNGVRAARLAAAAAAPGPEILSCARSMAELPAIRTKSWHARRRCARSTALSATGASGDRAARRAVAARWRVRGTSSTSMPTAARHAPAISLTRSPATRTAVPLIARSATGRLGVHAPSLAPVVPRLARVRRLRRLIPVERLAPPLRR